jgi:hypothetical protein
MGFAVISDHRSYFQGLEAALEFIDTQNVDFILGPGDFDPIEDGYTNYRASHCEPRLTKSRIWMGTCKGQREVHNNKPDQKDDWDDYGPYVLW